MMSTASTVPHFPLMPETTATLLHDLIDEVMQAARADGEAVDVMLEKMLLILRHDQQNG